MKEKAKTHKIFLNKDRAFDHSGKPEQIKGNHTNRRHFEIK
jgi:hypothetical protein